MKFYRTKVELELFLKVFYLKTAGINILMYYVWHSWATERKKERENGTYDKYNIENVII